MTDSVPAAARRIDARLRQLLGEERNTQVDFLLQLEEFDRSRGYEDFECANLWQYLQRELGLLEYAIYRRIHAMKLLRRFPQVEAPLRDGRLWMCALVELEAVITDENADEILAAASGKSFREVKVFVASRSEPLPGKPPVVRRVPEPTPKMAPADGGASESVVAETAETGGASLPGGSGYSGAVAENVDRPEPERSATFSSGSTLSTRPGRVEPVSPKQYDISVRVPAEFVEMLEKLKGAYSHDIPDRNIVAVLAKAMRSEIARIEKKTAPKTRAPRTEKSIPEKHEESARNPKVAHAKPQREPISAAVERQVRQRDGNRCQWALASGRTCGSNHQLEIDHRQPVARGGRSTVENLWQLCRAHNQMKARREFGPEFMQKFARNSGHRTHFSREKSVLASRVQNDSGG